MTMNRDRLAYWGSCDDCDARVVIYPGDDYELPDDQVDWEGRPRDCMICDGRVSWGGADPIRTIRL